MSDGNNYIPTLNGQNGEALDQFYLDTPTGRVFSVKGNGSAIFQGGVNAAYLTTDSASTVASAWIAQFNSGNGTVAEIFADGKIKTQGQISAKSSIYTIVPDVGTIGLAVDYTGNAGGNTFEVRGDGSMTTAGQIYTNNVFKARNLSDPTSAAPLFVGLNFSGGPAVTITGNGDALFEGTVTVNGSRPVLIALTPEDEKSWTTRTETYTETEYVEVPVINKPSTGTADIKDGPVTGAIEEPQTQTVAREVEKTRQVREYTGEYLDVKSELVALRDRAAAQDEVIAQLSKQLAALEKKKR